MSDQNELFTVAVRKTAVISPCGRYRYWLARHWDPNTAPLTWVMLNPSKADADLDDPTIRRCMGFARRDGFGGIVVVNLYAYRATFPAEMLAAKDPAGPENERYLLDAIAITAVAPIVCAWGNHGSGMTFLDLARPIRAELVALGTTKSGAPKHPLYVAGNAPFVPYPPEGNGDDA